MDDLQGEPKALRFIINQKALVTISLISSNWNNNVIPIISLMISNRIYTSMIFELGQKNKDFMSNNCREWVQHAIEISTNMFQIFKWELLNDIELVVQRSPMIRNVFKYSFLDIEISPLSFLTKWGKQSARYTPQQQGLHQIKTNTKRGQSSRASSRRTIILDEDAKGKEIAKESTLQDEHRDAQDPADIDCDEEYSKLIEHHYQKMLNEYRPTHDSLEEFDFDNDYDLDRSPKGPWQNLLYICTRKVEQTPSTKICQKDPQLFLLFHYSLEVQSQRVYKKERLAYVQDIA